MQVIGVIPARWGSTRFEGKVLAEIKGEPMIQHVWRRAKSSNALEEVFIACDDERVFDKAQSFGAKAIMTSPDHKSGTERIAKAFRYSPADIIINIQGDEPLIEPAVIDALAKAISKDSNCPMATVIKALNKEEELNNPNIVKVVVDSSKYALYFSRSAIPFSREKAAFGDITYYKHIGLYAYRTKFLIKFPDLAASSLEQVEKLEQLRALEAGYRIKTVVTEYESVGVDTPEDIETIERLMESEK